MGTKLVRFLAGGCFLSFVLVVVCAMPAAAQSVSGEKSAQSAPEKSTPAAAQSADREDKEEFEGADFLRRRAEYFTRQRAYPQAHIPAGARLRALDELHAMPLFGTGPLATSAWTQIGPSKMLPGQPYPFWGSPSDSGRVTALAVDPTNKDIVYLGAAEGGLWKSTNGGTTWTALTDSQPSLAVGSIAIDPTNSQTIYVGTGEGDNATGDGYYGAGILKSTNGGSTWTQMGGSYFATCSAGQGLPSNFAGSYINSLAVDPGNNQVVLAGNFFCPYGNQGVYRSADGGNTWTYVLGDPANGTVAGSSVVFVGSSGVAFAALAGPFAGGDTAGGVYKSTDHGQTWTPANGTGSNVLPSGTSMGRTLLAPAPSNPLVIYAVVISPSDTFTGLYKTVDGGNNWTLTTAPNFCTTQCSYDIAIAVSPTNANIVYAAGIYTFATNTSPGVATTVIGSTNGGATWTPVGSGTGTGTAGVHTDAHALAFSADATRLYAGSDGGAWKTADSATPANLNWTGLNAGLSTAQFYPGFAYDGVGDSIGGTQDNGSITRTSAAGVWTNTACGDGGFSAIDTTTSPYTFYTACTYNQGINMTTTPTNYLSWTAITTGINNTGPNADPALFIPPMVKDPTLPSTLYYGTNQIYQTTNAGTLWASISPQPLPGSTGNISTISIAPGGTATSGMAYAGTTDGQVVVGTNSGGTWTWTNVSSAGLPARYVTHVAINPTNPATAYATFSGFSGYNGDTQGHVFLTTNTGGTWTDISGNLPNIPVDDLVIDPLIANTLYAATDIGVFATNNGGITWSTYGTGLPNVAVLGLTLEPNTRKLAAATHGRSAWIIDLAPASGAATLTLSPAALTFAPQLINTPSTAQPVTLTVTGAVPLSISSITVDDKAFAVSSTTCAMAPATNVPGASCTLNITFTPGTTGLNNSAIRLKDNATGGATNIAVQGTGTWSTATLSPTALTFVPQLINTPSTPQPVTLTVTGTVPLQLSGFSSDSSDFVVTGTTCFTTNAPGSNCTVSVTYTPATAGLKNSKIRINGSFTGGKLDLPVSGTGTQDSIAPSSLTFNFTYPQQTTGSQNVTLTNAGTTVIHITGISITPDSLGLGEFTQTNTCAATLAARASCTVTVTFTGLQFGTDTANLQVTDDGANGAPELVPLTGTQN